ncbi:MAG: hypothetical protein Fur0023_11560 [Bacteroidia bacterium]
MKLKIKYDNPWQYIQNAKDLLKNYAIKEGEFYTRPKYVKTAGHVAYSGVLLALDELMEHNGVKIKHRKDANDYRNFLSKKNNKILFYFNEAYNYLHLFMGYDGSLSIKTSKTGLEYAEKIIEWVEKQLGKKWERHEN